MRKPEEFVQLIDRYRLGEARRLVVGVSISPDFSSVDCALVLGEGRGKCLRIRWIEPHRASLTEFVRDSCARLAGIETCDIAELAQTRADLAVQVAVAVRQAMALSRSSEKKLLGVSVADPGIWLRAVDGAISWEPLVAASVLAEQTGLSVIDELPQRDLACGGRGWPLEPLAWWLMFADRASPVARDARIAIDWSGNCRFAYLPPSDGLDDQIPAIRYQVLPGARFHKVLLRSCRDSTTDDGPAGLTSRETGKIASRLLDALMCENRPDVAPVSPDCGNPFQETLDRCTTIVRADRLASADVVKTLWHGVAVRLASFIGVAAGRAGQRVELVGGGPLDSLVALRAEIERHLPDARWSDLATINYHSASLQATTAAVLGFMHVDQMPATIPWLTGARSPRILGRLTPGSPASFRRLVMEMGDSRPPVMKLRDAV